MTKNFTDIHRTEILIDSQASIGPFKWQQHSIGHGGTNSTPLSEKVIAGTRKLQPKLVRIFLQEYFNVYPDHGVYNWSKLDAYMDSFAQTGAKVLATINFKPRILYPEINQDIWRPSNVTEWQGLIYQLVRRYSVEKPIVSYWEHVNEADIGVMGGCPYRIHSIEEYYEFYAMTIQPILEAFPQAKVGGPCSADYRVVPGFVDLCAQNAAPLDFVSYHAYQDDPALHRMMAESLSKKLDSYPGKRPELMINEWNKGFEPPWSSTAYDSVSVEEMASQPRRAAHIAKIILTMLETPLDWSFYYLLWEGSIYTKEFSSFFSPEETKAVMYKHWNEAPHRFGLFSENGRPRPQYFVYQILSRMGDERLAVSHQSPDLAIAAARGGHRSTEMDHRDTAMGQQISALIVNFDLQSSRDQIVKLHFDNLLPGIKRLSACRIDENRLWSGDELELMPYEQRTVDTLSEFEAQFYSPADSVLWVTLEDIDALPS